MISQYDKAFAAAIVSFLANAATNYFHVILPVDVQTAIAAFVVAVLVWAVPNKTA